MGARLGRPVVLTIAVIATAPFLSALSAGAQPPPFEPPPFASGTVALERIGERLPEVAAAYGLSPGELRTELLADDTLAVGRDLQLAYFDVLAPGEQASTSDITQASSAPPTTDPVFELASLPGAAKTIYLDFDGHVTEGTSWNTAYRVNSIVSPAYDLDGDAASWSATELENIRKSWETASEDFAPWNINVTTIEPGAAALSYSGGSDTQWGARAVITSDTFANCGCGGHAYVGSFDDSADEPTFVYNKSLVGVKEAITHEVGHMLNLAHDGTNSGEAYYYGHSVEGTVGWAPIMGAAYYQPLSQWSSQEYHDANNNGSDANYGYGRDDIAIISSLTNGNGFGLRADDHGDVAAAATTLAAGAPPITATIGTRTDVDVFAFSTLGGEVVFDADPAPMSPNLDIQLTLRNGDGAVVAFDNAPAVLDARITATVPAGDYTVEIVGVGAGSPAIFPPNGYTDYASIGRYTLTSTFSSAPPDTEAPTVPTGLTAATTGTGHVQLQWNDNTETDLSSYVVRRGTSAGGPYSDIATATTSDYLDTGATGGTYYYVVAARDTSGNVSADSGEATVTLPLVSKATGETAIAGMVTGTFPDTWAADGIAQTINEVESGGKPSSRHDLAEHRWSIPASQGNQTLTVVATVSANDEGFWVEWSNDGSTWMPLAPIAAGGSLNQMYEIGMPTGTVWVRVIDSDRSSANRVPGSISVDHLVVQGDGATMPPVPEATSVVATITTSTQGARGGSSYGVATVQVNDDLGTPVTGATVTVQFSGSFDEGVVATTDANGTAVARTSTYLRKPTFSACVAALLYSPLTYQPGNEAC